MAGQPLQKDDRALATGSQVRDLAKGCQDRALASGWQQQPKNCPEPLRKGIEAIVQYSRMNHESKHMHIFFKGFKFGNAIMCFSQADSDRRPHHKPFEKRSLQ